MTTTTKCLATPSIVPNFSTRYIVLFLFFNLLLILFVLPTSAHADSCTSSGNAQTCVPPTPPQLVGDWKYTCACLTSDFQSSLDAAVQNFFNFEVIENSWDLSTVGGYSIANEGPTAAYGYSTAYLDYTHQLYYDPLDVVGPMHVNQQPDSQWAWPFWKIKDHTDWTCPTGTTQVQDSSTPSGAPFMCTIIKPITSGCNKTTVPNTTPSTPNPCSITTGNKFKPQLDWQATVGPLRFMRIYNSLGSATAHSIPVGMAWTHNFNQRLMIDRYNATSGKVEDVLAQNIASGKNDFSGITWGTILRTDGRIVNIGQSPNSSNIASTPFINKNENLTLIENPDKTWTATELTTGNQEIYRADGMLSQIKYRNGQNITLSYDTTTPFSIPATSPLNSQATPARLTYNLTQAKDNFGQTLTFSYGSTGLLTSITLPTGKSITYTYDLSGRLSTVTRPGYGTKTYLYSENTTIAPSGNPNLLTGILDEKNVRFESYAYDTSDRGISTQKAGGVEQYTLLHVDADPAGSHGEYTTVTDPRGSITTYNKQLISGVTYVTSTVQNDDPSATFNEFDDVGNVTTSYHYGIGTNYTYDPIRNLETSRTEAVGTPQERTITTQYDPVLPLPILITESGRKTAYTYNANGNALTKKITDTKTNITRNWSYTYNSVGQKLTKTNPAGQITTYTYDSSGNGRLLTISDALGHVTTYSNYTALGQPGQVTLANGHKTQYVYDDAGRVTQTSETVYSDAYPTSDANLHTHWPQWIIDLINAFCKLVGSSSPFDSSGSTASLANQSLTASASRVDVTQYSYDPIGQLTQVQMPSGETLTYSYDTAHRLVGATDSLGNSISYTLNGAGDITNTAIQDPTGNIKVKTQQVFDVLGRVQQDIGNNGQSTTYNYDNFDNLTSTTDALSRSSSSTYDYLNRKSNDTDALGNTTAYSYNALDQLLTITDARNNTTTYTPNAFGENTKEVSPDTGTTNRIYSNGLLTSTTDSAGTLHSYSYDGLGRVLQRTDGAGTGKLTTQFGYDAGTYDTGYLTSVSNTNNSIHYSHDSLGNIIEKDSAISDIPLRVQYKYLAGNKLSDIMLPSGHHISYQYTNGKITSISTDSGTLLSNITYGPTGVRGWNWGTGTGDSYSLSNDLDGRITGVTSTGVLGRGYTFDAGNRILSIQDTPAGIGTQTFTHDNLDRLTQQSLIDQTLAYDYDANSNRIDTTKSPMIGASTASTYVIQSSTNRINNITTGSSSKTYTYLPTGQITKDSIRSYSYDATGRSISINNSGNTIYSQYNGLGERVRKASYATVLYFVYDESGHLLSEYDLNNKMVREYIWLGDRVVGMYSKDVPNTLLRVHTDHLGTVRAVSQGDGATRKVLWRFEGDAFGTAQATNPTSTVLTMPLRMPGQYFDSEVGTSYNYFRDYDASNGRYVESDPIGLEAGNNTYGYVGASPLTAIDPMGLAERGAAIGGAIGGTIGGLAGGLGGAFGGGALCSVVPFVGTVSCGGAGGVAGAAQGLINGAAVGAGIGSAIEDMCENKDVCHKNWGREIARCEIWRGRGPKGDPDRWYRACSDRARDRFTLCIKNGGKPDPNEPDEWSERDLK